MSNPLRDAARQLEEARKKLVDAINNATEDEWLPIQRMGQAVVKKLDDFTDKVVNLADVIDCKDPIKARASDWAATDGHIGSKTLNLKNDVQDHDKGIHGQEYWTGVSRNKYDANVQEQIRAIGSMDTAASAVQSALGAMGTGLQGAEHAGELAAAGVVSTVLSLAALIATGATGVGGICSALGVIAGAGTTILSVNIAISDLSDTQSAQTKALEAALKAQGEWPGPHTAEFDKREGWVPA